MSHGALTQPFLSLAHTSLRVTVSRAICQDSAAMVQMDPSAHDDRDTCMAHVCVCVRVFVHIMLCTWTGAEGKDVCTRVRSSVSGLGWLQATHACFSKPRELPSPVLTSAPTFWRRSPVCLSFSSPIWYAHTKWSAPK